MMFFNATATTEIYPYGHSLSLHDALPISERGARILPPRDYCRPGVYGSSAARWHARRWALARDAHGRLRRDGHREDPPGRSEEHTSELQPLMRISYAVFCLKKKPNNHTQLISSLLLNTIKPQTNTT